MSSTVFNQELAPLESLLFAFAMKLTKNRDHAKDLYQETVLRAFANRDKFKAGTNFKAWASTIMRNCFINSYRKQRTRNQIEQPLEDNTEFSVKKAVRNQASSGLMMSELNSILAQLDDKHQVPFELFFSGYEYQEIAERLGLPMGTVKSRIFFARKKLKRKVIDLYGQRPNLRA